GALLVAGFPYLPAVFRPVLAPLVDDPAALNAARLAIAFGLMAIPATALGALYGINTLGAVAGTLAAELILIPSLGLRASGFAAAACNLSAAFIAWRISSTADSPQFNAIARERSTRGHGR